MKNSECTIYIMFKNRWIQKFRKEKDGWTLTSSNGAVRFCSAEQLLSHMLPSLAGKKDHMSPLRLSQTTKLKLRVSNRVSRSKIYAQVYMKLNVLYVNLFLLFLLH
jgi:hypothetical protein